MGGSPPRGTCMSGVRGVVVRGVRSDANGEMDGWSAEKGPAGLDYNPRNQLHTHTTSSPPHVAAATCHIADTSGKSTVWHRARPTATQGLRLLLTLP